MCDQQNLLFLRGGASDDNLNDDDDDDENDNDSSGNSNGNSDSTTVTTTTTTVPTKISTSTTSTNENDKLYYVQQQLYLQSRSLQLRQALIQRGLHALAHTSSSTISSSTSTNNNNKKGNVIQQKRVVDWECAMSTEKYPKSCLYSLDAEYGQKVIAPMLPINDEDDDDDDDDDLETEKTTKKKNNSSKKYDWITISSLNRLYRTDPNKVETLWYDQYAILSTWFSSRAPHPYSLYTHFSQNIYATLITTALNLQPAWLLSVLLICTSMTLFGIIFLPVIESGMTLVLTSSVLWNHWPTWSRFTTHAALPVQLLMVQILFGFIQQGIQSLTNQIRTILIDEECRLLQNCIPLTIIEGRTTTIDTAADVTIPTEDEEEDNDDGDEE